MPWLPVAIAAAAVKDATAGAVSATLSGGRGRRKRGAGVALGEGVRKVGPRGTCTPGGRVGRDSRSVGTGTRLLPELGQAWRVGAAPGAGWCGVGRRGRMGFKGQRGAAARGKCVLEAERLRRLSTGKKGPSCIRKKSGGKWGSVECGQRVGPRLSFTHWGWHRGAEKKEGQIFANTHPRLAPPKASLGQPAST